MSVNCTICNQETVSIKMLEEHLHESHNVVGEKRIREIIFEQKKVLKNSKGDPTYVSESLKKRIEKKSKIEDLSDYKRKLLTWFIGNKRIKITKDVFNEIETKKSIEEIVKYIKKRFKKRKSILSNLERGGFLRITEMVVSQNELDDIPRPRFRLIDENQIRTKRSVWAILTPMGNKR